MGEKAAVLLRLGAVRAGIVGGNQDEAARHAQIGRPRKGIGRHVEAHLLHGDGRSAAGHAVGQRRLAGHLFIDRPFRMDRCAGLPGEGDDR